VLPLRHRVEVFSGIRPPDELLRRVAESATSPPPQPSVPAYGRPPPGPQARPPMGSGQHPEDPYLDPPPSYQDAMADNIRPIEGPRPGYNPGTATGPQGGLFADEKS